MNTIKLSFEWQVLLKCLDKRRLKTYEEFRVADAFGFHYWTYNQY